VGFFVGFIVFLSGLFKENPGGFLGRFFHNNPGPRCL